MTFRRFDILYLIMEIKNEIISAGLPAHVAIIMDGNGRWAQRQGLDRIYGHKQGVDTVRKVVEAAGEIGLKYLTLYTFSIENWNRPKAEVDALMGLMADAIVRETPELMRQGVRIKVIGPYNGFTRRSLAEDEPIDSGYCSKYGGNPDFSSKLWSAMGKSWKLSRK